MKNRLFLSQCQLLIGIIFIYLCAFNYMDAALPVQQPYDTAIEISKKFQKGELSKEEAIEALGSVLHDYSHSEGKNATLTQFIENTVGIENPKIYAASYQRGWSGSEVYGVVPDENIQKAQFFLKIYPCDSKHYLPEIFGLSFMREVQEIDSPKISALGQCFIDEARYFLVLETPVRGISIQQYFSRVGQYQTNSIERTQAFADLCEAVQACGSGLAKFHAHFPIKKQSFPVNIEEIMRQLLHDAIEELIYQPIRGIEIEKLQAYTEDLLQKMKAQNHLVGLTYDDVKTIHTFYDLISKRFSLINPSCLYFSLNQDGETQGLLVTDVCRYSISLALNRIEYFLDKNHAVHWEQSLTEEEVNVLKNIFELGYEQAGGVLPNAIEREFNQLRHHLFMIKSLRRALPEPEYTRIKDLIAISVEDLKDCLYRSM